MRTCDVCGNTSFHDERVDEVFCVDGQYVMVEHVPALVCNRCGEVTFNRETIERVRVAVRGGVEPVRQVNLDVVAFS